MRVDKNLEVSKIIRAIMKIHGKTMIFNNLYYTGTRTVKCYRGDDLLEDVICNALKSITHNYEIKRTPGTQYGRPGFIVKLK